MYTVTRKHFIMEGHWTSPELIAAIIKENNISEESIVCIQARFDIHMNETIIEITVADDDLTAYMINDLQ